MPKRFFKRYLPDPEKLKQQKALRFLGDSIFSADLWHLNRRSVTSAVSIGLFMAFVPIPGQMALAAAAAILTRSNLPLSVALVWVTNPITMGPLVYIAYTIGVWMLQTEVTTEFSYSTSWLSQGFDAVAAFLIGCFVLGVLCSSVGNISVRIFWRILVSRNWENRKLRRLRKKQLQKAKLESKQNKV